MATLLNLQTPEAILDPINATGGATVQVAYDGMSGTDRIVAQVTGHNAAATFQSEPQNGNAGGSVLFPVPAHVMGASQGRTPEVWYEVTRSEDAPKPSRRLLLTVGTLAANWLPTPEVPQAQNGVLDLVQFDGDATVKIYHAGAGYVWPLWGEGQTYWVLIQGTLDNGGNYERYLASPGVLTEAQGTTGLNLTLPRAQLESLRQGSPLTVTLKVAYDRSRVESEARVFPLLALTMLSKRDLPQPTVPEAKNGVIENPDMPVTLLVPAAATLRMGDQVRGTMGTLRTDPLVVHNPNAAVPIPVPASQLQELAGRGLQHWGYEVLESQHWLASQKIGITVETAKNHEDWETFALQRLALGKKLVSVSGITLELVIDRPYDDSYTVHHNSISELNGGKSLLITTTSKVRLSFNKSFTRFSGEVSHAEPGENLIEYFSGNKLIASGKLPKTVDTTLPFSYNATQENTINRIDITGLNPKDAGFFIDNLTWS